MLVNQQQQKSPVFIPPQNGIAYNDDKQMKEKGESRVWGIRRGTNAINEVYDSADPAETFGKQEVAVCIRTAGGTLERDPS